MNNLWSDGEAEATVARYARQGVNRDLALRVYTTRLLGGVPELVLHGGGNTSVKTTMKDTLGADVEVRRCGHGSVAQLALATTYPVRTATGDDHRPTWIRVTIFGERAEALAGLGMGSTVHVRGRLRQATFEVAGLRFQWVDGKMTLQPARR